MINDVFWFVFMLILSVVVSKILYSIDLGPFKPIRSALSGFGIIIHESSHAITCLITSVKISEIVLLTKRKNPETGNTYLHGHVGIKYPERLSFMQSFLTALAPLIIMTWLFFWCLDIAFTGHLDDFIQVLAALACMSLVLGACPSSTDFKFIPRIFSRDPRYAMYQILLVTLVIFLIWIITAMLGITILNFVNFIFIGMGYYGLKYGFLGISKGIQSLKAKRPQKFKYGKFMRKTHKAVQSQVEEAHW